MLKFVIPRCLIVLSILAGFLPKVSAQFPDSWTGGAIGGSSPYSFDATTGNITGSGADIGGTSDQFEFVSSTLNGDGTLVAQVASLTGTSLSASAKAGIMLRSDTTATAAHVSVLVTPGNGVEFEYRAVAGGTTTVSTVTGIMAPSWLKLVRSGAQFSAYYSSDGVTWNQVGTKTSLTAIPASAQAGLAVTSLNQGTGATAQFTNVALAANTAPTVAVAAAASPSPLVGTRALLSVLGADDGVENNLIYTWATTGTPPALVQFGANGTNASKMVTAIFTASGTYDFTVTITDGSGLTTTSSCSLSVTVPAGANVVMYHNDISSTGVNPLETQITPGSLNTSQFQKQYSTPVDGQIYAQPLYAHGVNITSGNLQGVQSVVYVATEHDSLYAIDAFGGNVLWQTSFLNSADPKVNLLGAESITTVPAADTGSDNLSPEVGITSTPALDLENGYIYVCAKSKQFVLGFTHYVHSVFKADIHSGAIVSSHILADTLYNGDNGILYAYRTTDTGTGTDPYCVGNGIGAITINGESRVYFNALRQFNRSALLLANGSLYIGSASHEEQLPYHGWLIRCDADTLAVNGAFNDTPNGGEGRSGIWMAGGKPAIDQTGDLYLQTADGAFDGNETNGLDSNGFPVTGNYGDCLLRLTDDPSSSPVNQNLNGWGLKVADYFSPQNNASLDSGDLDFGAGAPVVLPDSAGSPAHLHLVVGAGKVGTIFLVDRDNMGKFGPTDNVVQEWGYTSTTGVNGSVNTPAFFNGTLYYFPGYGGNGRAYPISNASFPASTGAYSSDTPDMIGSNEGTVSISANGTTNGIAWVLDYKAIQLKAYDASNLASEIWTSASAGTRDQLPGSVTKFVAPVIADGQVFVATQGSGSPGYLTVFGPPTPPISAPVAPSGLTALANVFNIVNLSWIDNSTNEDMFNIERSSDAGATWTQIGTASANATAYSDATTLATTSYQYRVRAHNSYQGDSYSDYSNVFAVTTPHAPLVGTGDGAAGAYYNDSSNDIHLAGTPALARVDPTINFYWGPGSSPDPTIGTTHYSVKWTGKIQAPSTDTYTFYTESDDAVRLWINGQLIIDNWDSHGALENTAAVQLSEDQLYTFEMDYYQLYDGALAQLLWSNSTITKQIIPQSQLYSGTAPAAPSNLIVTAASGTQLNLNWTDNSNNETGFSIERKIGAGGTYAVVATVNPNVTSYSDGGLVPNTTYYYRVQATNFAANSLYSNEASALTPIPPLNPSNAAATNITASSVTLTWTDSATNADGYRVVRYSPILQDIVVAANLPSSATTFTDVGAVAGIVSGTEYQYHIYAYNVAGYSATTEVDTATLALPPAGLAATGADGAVNLTWTAPTYDGDPSNLNYNIYRGMSPGRETLIASSVSTTSFADTGLRYGQTYYYKVSAVDLGGNSALSDEVPAVATTPTSFQVTFGSARDVPIAASSFTATNGTVNFALNFAPATGTNLTVVKNFGLNFINGVFSNLAQGQTVLLTYNGVNYAFVANYYGGSGRDLVLQWANALPLGWGSNNLGQLGNGSGADSAVPSAVDTTGVLAGKTVVAMAVGGAHSLALCADGTLAAWGDNFYGELGNDSNTNSNVPVAVDITGVLAGKAVVAIAAGAHHSVALCADGTLAAWGSNASGELGNDSNADSNVPVAVDMSGALSGESVVGIASGDQFNLAQCGDGTLVAWGANGSGQLGNGSTTDSNVPVAVNAAVGSALSGETVMAIAAGAGYSLALCADGTLAVWGDNTNGQLGNNSTTNSSVPVAVDASSDSALFGETVTAIAAGAGHSLALCADGTVAAWGLNANGQLGNGSSTSSSVPVAVNVAAGSALSGETVSAIAAGVDHTLAVCGDGTMAAWGANRLGQLGNNSDLDSPVPVAVSAGPLAVGERWVLVANGEGAWHALALAAGPPEPEVDVQQPAGTSLVDGTSTVDFGTLVVGNAQDLVFTVYNSGAAPLTGLAYSFDGANASEFAVVGTPDTSVAVGGSTTATVRFTAAGSGARTATLHIASNDPTDNPFDIALTGAGVMAPAVTTLAASAVTATGATLNGTVNANNNDSTVSFDYGADTSYGINVASTPSPVTGTVATAVSVTIGGLSPGTTYHFRVNGTNGVGAANGADLTFTTATNVSVTYSSATDVPITASSFIAANNTITFTLNFAPTPGTNLTVVNNTGREFIQGTFNNLAQGQTVVLPYNGVNYTFVANYFGGDGDDLVLQWADVRLLSWGDDGGGQLGRQPGSNYTIPGPVNPLGVLAGKVVTAVATGYVHSLALCSDGTLAAWGDNGNGQLGNNSGVSSSVPVAVDQSGVLAGKTVVAIACGEYHSLALCSDGTVAAWGLNWEGQLGSDIPIYSPLPVAVDTSGVLAGKTVVAIAAGESFSLALCSDGTLAAWGDNFYGELGNDSNASSTVPVAVDISGVLAGKTVMAIAAGGLHCLALCADGTVAAWGDGTYGQLGNNSGTASTAPVVVDTSASSAIYGKSVIAIAAGYLHSLALCSDGTPVTWGYNVVGQLGTGTATDSSVPVAVDTSGVLAGKTVRAITAGSYHNLVLCADGTLAAWGADNYGELGDNNNATDSLAPVLVDTSMLTPAEQWVMAASGSRSNSTMALAAVPPTPTATTLAANSITTTSVTLTGTVNANNNDSTVSFDYGADISYGVNVAGTPSLVSGGSPTAVSATVTGLNPGITYHFRVNGTNVVGTSNGLDATFTTLSTNSALSALALSTGTLSPTFDGGTTAYTAIVLDTTASVSVTPTVADTTATVQVNGVSVTSGTASDPINLNVGNNTIDVLVTAQDGATTTDYSVVVTRLTNLQVWRQTYFNTTANSGSAADTFDYAGDGVPNLMKYAFGLDPTSVASVQLPQPVLSGDLMTIAFTESAGASGITYGAEWTESLNPPQWTSVPDTGFAPNHIFSISVTGHPSLYMRLKVSDP